MIFKNISGSINFSPEPEPALSRSSLTQYVESNLIRRQKTKDQPTQFGIIKLSFK